MHLHNCRCFQEHLRMLWQSLRAHCLAPEGPGSIWNYVGAPVRSTRVSSRFGCGFRTDLHLPDELYLQTFSITASKCISKLPRSWPPNVSPDSFDFGLQAHIFMASECISKLAWSQCRSASPSLHDHGLQVYL